MVQLKETAQTRERTDAIRSCGGHWLVGCIWLFCVLYGFWLLLEHDTDTGGAYFDQDGTRATLVRNDIDPIASDVIKEFAPGKGELYVTMALHPKCPCTRASLAELERLLQAESNPTRCVFLVSLPTGKSISWIDTDTTNFAKAIANSQLVVDVDGKRAQQLGLKNSGAILIVQPDGTVSFTGGITSGRTCSQQNPGSVAVASLFRGEAIDAITTPTFGCPLK